jgi:hypothetical protein
MADASVLMCRCDVKFTGMTSVGYAVPPRIGVPGRCILFVREAERERIPHILKDFGWEALHIVVQPLTREELDTPSMEPFRQHYETCLKDGHSFVWYS